MNFFFKYFFKEKEEEIENLRKNMQFEIDRLTAALADAEARMKAEISRLKKKYQAEIAELEMTVDNLNRANIEAQKTIKKQSEQLKVLQASLEDTQRQLQQTLDQVYLYYILYKKINFYIKFISSMLWLNVKFLLLLLS